MTIMCMRSALAWLVVGLASVAGCAVFIFAGIYLVMPVLMWSQASKKDDYIATCESAATRLPIAVEVERLFPGKTDHFITHYGFNRYGGERTNVWNSEAYFYGRYSLTMQIKVVVDYKNNTITRASQPTFYLVEYHRVEENGNGIYSAVSNRGITFGEEEWRNIYEKGGDFSSAGMSLRKDAPVDHMKGYVRAMRRPRIPITLLPKTTNSGSL